LTSYFNQQAELTILTSKSR